MATLPGMPPMLGDPGVFACKIPDGAPASGRHRTPAPTPPPTPPRDPMAGVWLVLTLCPHCNARTGRYCHLHDMRLRPLGRT